MFAYQEFDAESWPGRPLLYKRRRWYAVSLAAMFIGILLTAIVLSGSLQHFGSVLPPFVPPPPIECGDGVREGAEECDGADLGGHACSDVEGASGTLSCFANCTLNTSGCHLCGDDASEGPEVCDGSDLGGATCVSEGFDGGTLACSPTCAAFDTSGCQLCGNDIREGAEACDGSDLNNATCVSAGFDGGALACNANCTALDTSGCQTCGNGTREGTEVCDGTDLDGQTCRDVGFVAGTLACQPSCGGFNTSACVEMQKLVASDRADGDSFSFSVSSGDGSTIIVGAPFKNGNRGAAYVVVFVDDTWTEQQKLTGSDLAPGDFFGYSAGVSDSGNTVIIGAPDGGGALSDCGSAYIFTRSGENWTQQQILHAGVPENGCLFGGSVAMSGDGYTAVVGADRYDDGVSNAGAAFVLAWNGTAWAEQATLEASDRVVGDSLGFSASISDNGSTTVVGAPGADPLGSASGAAYVFVLDGEWAERQKLTPTDGAAADQFGYAVAISGDGSTILVGAPSGSAYAFAWNGTHYVQQAKLTADDFAAGDSFGASVSLDYDGNTAIIGAFGEDDGAADGGSVYIFTRSGAIWTQARKVTPGDVAAFDNFGTSVSVDGAGLTFVAGSPYAPVGIVEFAGAAYVFS